MVMKKQITLLVLVLCSLSAFSQLDLGFRAGLSSSSIKVDDVIKTANGDTEFEYLQGDATIGFHAGITARISFMGLFVQPDILFTHSGGEIEVKSLSGENVTTTILEQKFNKIDIPIMVGYKFGPVHAQVGPIASIMLSSTSEIANVDDYEDKFNSATWGFQAGVGFDILMLGVDLKYEGSFSKLGNKIPIGDKEYELDSRNNQFVLSLTYYFMQ